MQFVNLCQFLCTNFFILNLFIYIMLKYFILKKKKIKKKTSFYKYYLFYCTKTALFLKSSFSCVKLETNF